MRIVPVFLREYKLLIWKNSVNYYGIETGIKCHHSSGLLYLHKNETNTMNGNWMGDWMNEYINMDYINE